jgi:hypothetical protein
MINFGFDDSLSVDENGNMDVPYPNAYNKELYWFDMDVYHKKYGNFPIMSKNMDRNDYIFLNGRSICVNLNNDLYLHRKDAIDNYIKNNESFTYPILIWNNDLFKGEANIVLSDKVKEQIRLNKCKLVIFYITEPWFMHEYCYVWMSNFSKENNFSKSSNHQNYLNTLTSTAVGSSGMGDFGNERSYYTYQSDLRKKRWGLSMEMGVKTSLLNFKN